MSLRKLQNQKYHEVSRQLSPLPPLPPSLSRFSFSLLSLSLPLSLFHPSAQPIQSAIPPSVHVHHHVHAVKSARPSSSNMFCFACGLFFLLSCPSVLFATCLLAFSSFSFLALRFASFQCSILCSRCRNVFTAASWSIVVFALKLFTLLCTPVTCALENAKFRSRHGGVCRPHNVHPKFE